MEEGKNNFAFLSRFPPGNSDAGGFLAVSKLAEATSPSTSMRIRLISTVTTWLRFSGWGPCQAAAGYQSGAMPGFVKCLGAGCHLQLWRQGNRVMGSTVHCLIILR